MRVSRHFDEAEWTGNRQSSLPTDSIPKSGRFLTPTHYGLKRNFRCARVVGSDAAMTSPTSVGPTEMLLTPRTRITCKKKAKEKEPREILFARERSVSSICLACISLANLE